MGRENAFFTGFSFLTLLINKDLRLERAKHRTIEKYKSVMWRETLISAAAPSVCISQRWQGSGRGDECAPNREEGSLIICMSFLVGETHNSGCIKPRRRAKIAIMRKREWERDSKIEWGTKGERKNDIEKHWNSTTELLGIRWNNIMTRCSIRQKNNPTVILVVISH